MRRDDVHKIKHLSPQEFRVLTAVEMGMRNHEHVPERTVAMIANLRHGGVHKVLSQLMQNSLAASISTQKHKGYRLTWMGYDFLALRALLKKDVFCSFGSKMAVGKESDIFSVCNAAGEDLVLKIHRLGRTSFRKVKEKRDYLGNRSTASWIYLSRLSALKEFAFLKVLEEHGFPVPRAHGHNRHVVVMSLVKGKQLQQVYELRDVEKLYHRIMTLATLLARHGLIHCDFNEYNLMVQDSDESPVLIDFPQMVSTSHFNAPMYFERDVDCIRKFFSKRFKFESEEYPTFEEVVGEGVALDIRSKASGYIPDKKELQDAFESRFIVGGAKLEGEESEEESDTESCRGSDEDEGSQQEEHLDILEDDEEEEGTLNVALTSLQISEPAPENDTEEEHSDSCSGSEGEEEEEGKEQCEGRPAAVQYSNKARKTMKEKIKRQYKQVKNAQRRAKLKGEVGKKKKSQRDAQLDLKTLF